MRTLHLPTKCIQQFHGIVEYTKEAVTKHYSASQKSFNALAKSFGMLRLRK